MPRRKNEFSVIRRILITLCTSASQNRCIFEFSIVSQIMFAHFDIMYANFQRSSDFHAEISISRQTS